MSAAAGAQTPQELGASCQGSDADAAIAACTTLVDAKQDPPGTRAGTAYFFRGVAYLKKNDNDRAIPDLTEAIKLNPMNANARTNRGAAYARKGQLDEALSDFSASLAVRPDDAPTLLNRGNIYSVRNQSDAAIQ